MVGVDREAWKCGHWWIINEEWYLEGRDHEMGRLMNLGEWEASGGREVGRGGDHSDSDEIKSSMI